MPIPIPFPPPTPTPLLEPSTKQPFYLAPDQTYAESAVLADHIDALYRFGEYSMFVMMWRAVDFDNGLVQHCSVCMTGDAGRYGRAYQQAPSQDCSSCFGTTFEGGYRARIVRPAIWTDRRTDTVDGSRGEYVTDSVTIETTSDFTLHHGDYAFRQDGTRYSCDEISENVIRSGFGSPDTAMSIGGIVSNARLEDQASIAYLIPPTPSALAVILSSARGMHTPPDFSQYEVTNRGPVLLSSEDV